MAGLMAARARGRLEGRPPKLNARKAEMAQRLYDDKTNTIDDICRALGISRVTLYRYIKPIKAEDQGFSKSA